MTTTSEKKGGLPITFGDYNRFDVISAFHKELRRGDIEQATYWLQVMLSGGATNNYVTTYLWKVAAEELAPSELETANYLGWCREHSGEVNAYHLYYAVLMFCRSKKWWEDADGKRVRELWAKHQFFLHNGGKREVPHYAHDKHTTRGKSLIAKGEADLRWEGSWRGMVWRAEAQAIIDAHNTLAAAGTADPDMVARTLDDVKWMEVWGRPEWDKMLAHFEYLEANGM